MTDFKPIPVSKFWFMVFRLIPPFLLATFSTFLLLLVEPFFGFPLISSLAYSILAGLVAPTMALFVATMATNKIEAMTWQKLFNLPLILPIANFFVPEHFSALFGIFPTFWAYRGFDAFVNSGNFWMYILVGFAYSIATIVWLTYRFTRRHFK
jgi:fluoroquinolone transport system permease protein